MTSGGLSLSASSDSTPLFKWKSLGDLHRQQLTTYRLLDDQLLTSSSCIKWHDNVTLQLSKNEFMAFIDTDSEIKFSGNSFTIFTIIPRADQIHQNGCIHFDEDFHLAITNNNNFVHVESTSDKIISSSVATLIQVQSITATKAPVSVNAKKAMYKNKHMQTNLVRNGGFDDFSAWSSSSTSGMTIVNNYQIGSSQSSVLISEGSGDSFSQAIWSDGAPKRMFYEGEKCTFGMSVYSTHADDSQISIVIIDSAENSIMNGGIITLSQIDGGRIDKWNKYSHTFVMAFAETSDAFIIKITNSDNQVIFDGVHMICQNAS